MHASPSRTHRSPGYPTRLEINADPELLRRHLPATWAASPELATAAALLLTLALPGCRTAPAAGAKPQPTPATGPAIVAPLFEHGDGFAATGCVIVSPPSYFTEDESWQIIDAELAKHGLKLTEKEYPIPGVEIPLYRSEDLAGRKDGDPLPAPISVAPIKADRTDSRHRIALEFVSGENPPEKAALRFADESGGTIGSVEFKAGAEQLRIEVGSLATEKVYFGVLYDPIPADDNESYVRSRRPSANATPADREAYQNELNARARAKSKYLLRQQVRDFVKWLQAQGAI